MLLFFRKNLRSITILLSTFPSGTVMSDEGGCPSFKIFSCGRLKADAPSLSSFQLSRQGSGVCLWASGFSPCFVVSFVKTPLHPPANPSPSKIHPPFHFPLSTSNPPPFRKQVLSAEGGSPSFQIFSRGRLKADAPFLSSFQLSRQGNLPALLLIFPRRADFICRRQVPLLPNL